VAAVALACVLTLAPRLARADDALPEAGAMPQESQLTPETACAAIHRALTQLAKAERDQAFALDLDAGGGATTMVEARLATVLDRTNTLRAALRVVRQSTVARDPRSEQCMRMGFHALVQAEKLTTNVEEVLYGPNLSRAGPHAPLRSDAAPPAPPVR
jgi:hypothetical protein